MALIDINWNPSSRDLRIFGLAGAIFFAAFGAWLNYKGTAVPSGLVFVLSAATAIGLFTTPRAPRGPGLVFCLLLASIGVAIRWAGLDFGPLTHWGIAAILLLAALAVPAKLAAAYAAWMTMAFPIGWLVSHAVLTIIFFGLFTIVALLFRLIGRDAMTRRFEPDAQSYWVPRRPVDSKKRYFRQF